MYRGLIDSEMLYRGTTESGISTRVPVPVHLLVELYMYSQYQYSCSQYSTVHVPVQLYQYRTGKAVPVHDRR